MRSHQSWSSEYYFLYHFHHLAGRYVQAETHQLAGWNAVATAGASRGVKVSHVFVENTALQKHLPPYLSQFVTRKLIDLGIDVQSSRLVTGLNKSSDENNFSIYDLTLDALFPL